MSVPLRTRTVYLSSDNIDYFKESNRSTIYLRDPIVPEDGHTLAYGLSSIGFNATSMNISDRLGNNSLTIRLEFDGILDDYTMIPNPGWDTTSDGSVAKWLFPLNGGDVHANPVDHEIIVPDGQYTFEELLDYLSNESNDGGVNYIVPSGYYVDAQLAKSEPSNILPVTFKWNITKSGFTINLVSLDTHVRSIYDDGTLLPLGDYKLTDIQPILKSVVIMPTSDKPKLYNTLFTNYNTNYPDTPISVPHNLYATGMNPPLGIRFTFPSDIIREEGDTSVITPMKFDLIDLQITEIGNESIYDTANFRFPDKTFNTHKYTAYYQATLDPIYVDVNISLSNYSIDEEGYKNILTRLFTFGVKEGNNSLFRAWSNPKMTTLDGESHISSIDIDFKPQDGKWDIFNLEFSLELIVCEYLIEPIVPIDNVNLNPTDPISSTSDEVGNHRPSPLTANHFSPYVSSRLHLNKKTRFM